MSVCTACLSVFPHHTESFWDRLWLHLHPVLKKGLITEHGFLTNQWMLPNTTIEPRINHCVLMTQEFTPIILISTLQASWRKATGHFVDVQWSVRVLYNVCNVNSAAVLTDLMPQLVMLPSIIGLGACEVTAGFYSLPDGTSALYEHWLWKAILFSI